MKARDRLDVPGRPTLTASVRQSVGTGPRAFASPVASPAATLDCPPGMPFNAPAPAETVPRAPFPSHLSKCLGYPALIESP